MLYVHRLLWFTVYLLIYVRSFLIKKRFKLLSCCCKMCNHTLLTLWSGTHGADCLITYTRTHSLLLFWAVYIPLLAVWLTVLPASEPIHILFEHFSPTPKCNFASLRVRKLTSEPICDHYCVKSKLKTHLFAYSSITSVLTFITIIFWWVSLSFNKSFNPQYLYMSVLQTRINCKLSNNC